MQRERWVLGTVLMVAALVVLPGCPENRMEGQDWQPSPGEATPLANKPGPDGPVAPPPDPQPKYEKPRKDVVQDVKLPLEARLSEEEKQRIIEKSKLFLVRTVVSSEEAMGLSTGAERSTAAKDALTTRLTELGFNVIQTNESLSFSPPEAWQDGFRLANDCNLMFLLQGKTVQRDKFGNFSSHGAELKAKAVNLTTHQIIASKTFTRRGKRALMESEAAEDALKAAAGDAATYLTDEVARKVEATSLVRVVMLVTNLDNAEMADDLRVGLQKRAGIYFVSIDQYDTRSQSAWYEVLCRADVQRFLTAYVGELRKGNVEVKEIRRNGELIQARRKSGG